MVFIDFAANHPHAALCLLLLVGTAAAVALGYLLGGKIMNRREPTSTPRVTLRQARDYFDWLDNADPGQGRPDGPPLSSEN